MRETSVSTRTRVIGIVTIILGIAALLDWGILANRAARPGNDPAGLNPFEN